MLTISITQASPTKNKRDTIEEYAKISRNQILVSMAKCAHNTVATAFPCPYYKQILPTDLSPIETDLLE